MNASGLVRARGQLAFIVGLALASVIVLAIERRQYVPAADIPPVSQLVQPIAGDVEARWRFVERNRDGATGLVNSEEGSGWTTVSGSGDALQAMLAAHRLGLIDGQELYHRVDSLLQTIAQLPPHAAGGRIDSHTGRRITESKSDSAAPLIGALELVAWSYPANSAQAAQALSRWRHASNSEAVPAESSLHQAATVLMEAALVARRNR